MLTVVLSYQQQSYMHAGLMYLIARQWMRNDQAELCRLLV